MISDPSSTAVFVILCVLLSHFDCFSLPDHKPHENEDCVCFDSLSDFPDGSDGKESAMQEASIPGLERPPGERNGYPLQYSWPGEFHGQRSLKGYSP